MKEMKSAGGNLCGFLHKKCNLPVLPAQTMGCCGKSLPNSSSGLFSINDGSDMVNRRNGRSGMQHGKTNKKTAYTDIDAMEVYGMRIHGMHGWSAEYRLEKNEDGLNYAEVKMLIDTVRSSRFLAEKQAE